MSNFLKRDYLPVVIILAISIMYWLGVSSVPFHPDESTQLFMAADFQKIFAKPSTLIWQPNREADLRLYYREVDPPLSRYLIGFGLWISGQKPLDQDWDWSKSWQANQQAGAFPSSNQLLAGRLAVASLFPFSLACAFWMGKKLRSPALGWLVMGLVAINALVLIHTRRAMAESGLLFGILFSLLGVISWQRQRFLLALPVALAFNAKYTAFPLILIGLAAVFWGFRNQLTSWKKKLIDGAAYCALFLVVTFILNPFLWRAPVSALKDAITRRQDLMARQGQEIGRASSVQVLKTVGQRGVAVLSQTFFAPPASADVGNYKDDLQPSVDKYEANPLHMFMRSWLGGAIILFLTLSGFILFIFWLVRSRPITRAGIFILFAFLIQLAAIFATIQFPFQRYYIPLIPYTSLFLAICLLYPFELIFQRKNLQGK